MCWFNQTVTGCYDRLAVFGGLYEGSPDPALVFHPTPRPLAGLCFVEAAGGPARTRS